MPFSISTRMRSRGGRRPSLIPAHHPRIIGAEGELCERIRQLAYSVRPQRERTAQANVDLWGSAMSA